jgi:hypothetical protein
LIGCRREVRGWQQAVGDAVFEVEIERGAVGGTAVGPERCGGGRGLEFAVLFAADGFGEEELFYVDRDRWVGTRRGGWGLCLGGQRECCDDAGRDNLPDVKQVHEGSFAKALLGMVGGARGGAPRSIGKWRNARGSDAEI